MISYIRHNLKSKEAEKGMEVRTDVPTEVRTHMITYTNLVIGGIISIEDRFHIENFSCEPNDNESHLHINIWVYKGTRLFKNQVL